MTTDPNLQAAFEQIVKLWIVLQRPVLQRQLLAFIAAALLAWFLADRLWRLFGYRFRRWVSHRLNEDGQRYWQRGLLFVEYATFPALGFLTVQMVNALFLGQGWRAELVMGLGELFGLILYYRLFIALLITTLGESYVRHYRYRILGPLFTLFILYRIVNNLVDTAVLADVQLLQIFGISLTLGALLFIVIALYFLFYFSRAIQDLLQEVIAPRTETDPNVIYVALTIGRYVVIALAFLIVFRTLGLDLTTLAFISGGLSIGIGFGLQEIVANFISGTLLLFEQSLRPGDVISVGGEMGEVKNLSIRATTVTTLDNVELIVPNQLFLTSTVTSYTKTNRSIRVLIPVGVSYGSDPKEVREVLLETAQRHQLVRTDPEPVVHFMDFGDSSLDFRLAVWVDDPLVRLSVASDLRFMLWKALAEHNIEIPFPQRDLHIRSSVLREMVDGKTNPKNESGLKK